MGYLARFLTEARRRKVFRTAGLYVVGAWVLLQVADLALESLGQPGEMLRYVWVLAFAGFPLALIFGWYYDISVAGIRRTSPASGGEPEDLSLKVPDYILVAALAIITGLVAAGVLERARISGDMGSGGIAVLPLENLSGDSGQDYFAAGMQDALITSLSKISALRVVSRTSTLRLDPTLTVPQIADALGVRHIIEGSVSREADRVRVIVQLIDATTDDHVWAENFERKLESVLQLQSEMARSIASAVDVQLSNTEHEMLSVQRPVDPEIYDTYLRGMHLINQERTEDRRRGIEILEGLVEIDPSNAQVFAGLAYGYAMLGHDPVAEGIEPASKLAAARALELDDTLAEAHLSLGTVQLYFEWDVPAAEASLRRAIDLNPNLAEAYLHLAFVLELYGPGEDSRALGEKAANLDPLSPFVLANVGAQYWVAGLHDRALAYVGKTLQLDPGNTFVRWLEAMIYTDKGDFERALLVAEGIRNDPAFGFTYGVVLARSGDTEAARRELDAIDPTPRNVLALVMLNGVLGNHDELFRWLETARDIRLAWYPWLVVWFPEFEGARKEPRMRELAEDIGLEDYL
jgi:TolB-like protein/Tfp pilus assembly protein PilF